MNNILEIILSGIIMGYFANICWNKIMNKKIDFKNWKIHLYSIITAVFQFTIYYYVNSYIKVVLITVVFAILIKFFYKIKINNAMLLAIVFQVLVFVSELICSILLSIIAKNNSQFIIDIMGTFVLNLIISILALLILSLFNFNKLYQKLLNITNKLKLFNLVIFVLILIFSINIFLAIPYYKIDTLSVIIINSIMIIVYSFIVFKFVEQKNRYIDINDKYSLTATSLKELQNNINRLMTVNHEHKNQILTIRTMVANKDKDVLKNIDAIIDRKIKDDKELKIRTSVISNTMLGALVYSKLLTMKENNINHNIHIDKSLSKFNFINLGDKTNVDICKIIGVYLDNAIEAVSELKEKEINIDLYSDEGYLFILIANTFKGDVDINAIHDYGYTTKSEGHGYGLALVKEVIKENNNLDSETEIIDQVFVQKLKIKM